MIDTEARRARKIPTASEADMAQVVPPADGATDGKRKRSRRSSAAPDRAAIRSAVESVNAMLIVGGLGKYALTEEEITAETDALYLVAVETPAVGTLLIKGKRFTAWGQLLWVNYVILARRRVVPDASGIFAPHPAGPARADQRNDRERQDDAASPARGSA